MYTYSLVTVSAQRHRLYNQYHQLILRQLIQLMSSTAVVAAILKSYYGGACTTDSHTKRIPCYILRSAVMYLDTIVVHSSQGIFMYKIIHYLLFEHINMIPWQTIHPKRSNI